RLAARALRARPRRRGDGDRGGAPARRERSAGRGRPDARGVGGRPHLGRDRGPAPSVPRRAGLHRAARCRALRVHRGFPPTRALLLMWATSHVSRALFSAPLHLFDAGIFYPLRHTLAFGDHMIGEALIGLPLWLATGNPLLEYNVLVLASYALGATAAFVYAREQTGGVAPAV